MSTMLLLWLATFFACAVLAIQRSAWAVALYMLTFFLAPHFWWWGAPIDGYRWNFIAGFILLASTFITGSWGDPDFLGNYNNRRFVKLAVLLLLNAVVVHYFIAPDIMVSSDRFVILVKSMLFFIVLITCIRNENDLRIVILSVVLGAAYVGYEVTINGRGHIANNRLEDVGVPNASSANDLACLMVSCMSLVAPLFLFGRFREKILAVLVGPLILNVLIACNSRGAFLSLPFLGLALIIGAPAGIRSKITKIIGLGIVAGSLLLGDGRIVNRFLTTFDDAGQRDTSASSRIDFWIAGITLISDHPFGAGGDAFEKTYGPDYVERVTGTAQNRSVHQGYINEACDWGIQGLLLRLMIICGGILLSFQTARITATTNQNFLSVVSLSVGAALVSLLCHSLVGTFLDNEWGLWLVAISLGCNRLVEETVEEDPSEEEPFEELEIFDNSISVE